MDSHKVIQHSDLIEEFLELTYHKRDYKEQQKSQKTQKRTKINKRPSVFQPKQ